MIPPENYDVLYLHAIFLDFSAHYSFYLAVIASIILNVITNRIRLNIYYAKTFPDTPFNYKIALRKYYGYLNSQSCYFVTVTKLQMQNL